MILIEHRACESCAWWRRLDEDSDVGACESFANNDYAGAYVEGEGEVRTYAHFSCADYARDGDGG